MKFSIVKRYKIFFAITITFLIIGIGSMLFKGFNLGIDFTGGSIMDLEFKNPVTVSQVREVLKEKNLGNAIIQLESSDSNAKSSKGVLIRTGVISDEQRQQVMTDLKSKVGEQATPAQNPSSSAPAGAALRAAAPAAPLRKMAWSDNRPRPRRAPRPYRAHGCVQKRPEWEPSTIFGRF